MKRRLRIGDHIEHTPSGDYLGTVTDISANGVVIKFSGKRMRDGFPVTFATKHEVQRCTSPIAEARPSPMPH